MEIVLDVAAINELEHLFRALAASDGRIEFTNNEFRVLIGNNYQWHGYTGSFDANALRSCLDHFYSYVSSSLRYQSVQLPEKTP